MGLAAILRYFPTSSDPNGSPEIAYKAHEYWNNFLQVNI